MCKGLKFLLLVSALSITAKLPEFKDIVRQRKEGNNIAQCPCVIHPESGRCFVYNPMYQAVNVEEAMFTFPDLTMHVYPEKVGDVASYTCTTTECQQCFSLLYYQLLDNGLIEKTFKPATRPLERNALRPTLCPRYTFLREPKIPPAPKNVPPYVKTMIQHGLQIIKKALPQVMFAFFFLFHSTLLPFSLFRRNTLLYYFVFHQLSDTVAFKTYPRIAP
ncbi:unnamed protein product [Strongylus vulgaris]|uniref:Uncharacterized protein n=1 Tax=Strongylus vulgaris TaxID=40348 RepID=A0A3P7IWD6_STRVU|nr:unnamed protein product [Strongylus vulgaris]